MASAEPALLSVTSCVPPLAVPVYRTTHEPSGIRVSIVNFAPPPAVPPQSSETLPT